MKKLFAKIHLWISVPFGLVISILCLTGAALIFETELLEWFQPSRYKASMATESPLPVEQLIPLVKQQLPDSVSISSVQFPAGADKNYRMGITGQGRTSLLVDPYTGEIKGKVVPYQKGTFFSFVRRLHRWFLFEFKRGGEGINWGKMITGTSTLVFVFVLLSGLVIWVPNTIQSLKRKLSIQTGKGTFRFWYDTHLAGGMYALIFLLAMSLTGLTWSFDWYRTGFYKVFGVETHQNAGHGQTQVQSAPAPPQQDQPVQGGEPRGERAAGGEGRPESQPERGDRPHSKGRPQSDATEAGERTAGEGRPEDGSGRGGRPQSEGRPEGKPERGERTPEDGRPHQTGSEAAERTGRESQSGEGRSSRGGRTAEVDYTPWTKVAATLKERNPSYRSISVQNGTATVSIHRTGNTRASDRYTFDARTGEITEVQYYKDLDKSAKIRGWIYSVHVGSWGGIVTRILYFIACLLGATLPLTGYYIFLKKRWKKWTKKRKAQTV
ncbi:MAG: PepSY domain-containing protein [Bacteroides sp.]|nr:PepSY domain-containing protein [Bacteroides sp.]